MSDRGEGGPAVLDPQAGFFESRHSVTISVRSRPLGTIGSRGSLRFAAPSGLLECLKTLRR